MSNILIVDDNVQNLYLARFLLEQAGHNIDEVYDGQQAVNYCKNKDLDIDLVLMDVQMPVMDGLTATAAIKASGKSDLTIIALTARAMTGDRESILEAGCDGYIKKPIAADTFVELVETHLT